MLILKINKIDSKITEKNNAEIKEYPKKGIAIIKHSNNPSAVKA